MKVSNRHNELKQGDIFWIEHRKQFETGNEITHPHVIIQDNVINRSRVKTVVMCALTSNMKRANEPGNVLLDLNEANLKRRSIVVVSQVETINKADLKEYIGTLSSDRVQQIFNGMKFQQKTFFGFNEDDASKSS